MAEYEPLIPEEKIDCSLLDKAFEEYPHDIYVLYDDIADEFIIKFLKPKSPTSLYSLNEDISVIITLDDYKIIGIVFFDFQKRQLNHYKELEKVWYKKEYTKSLHHYKHFRYNPKDKPKPEPQPYIYVGDFLTRQTDKLCKELIPA